MTSWQGAWWLLRYEGKRSWSGLLITIILFAYINVVLTPLFNDLLTLGSLKKEGWIGNFLYLTILPSMGFVLNRTVFNYWRNDPFTRKLAYWRTLPISWNVIVLARMLQHVIVLTIVSVFFFALQYILLRELRAELSLGEYVMYGLTWYGYAMMLGATYVYFEQTTNGKQYFFISLSYSLLYVCACFILGLTDTNLLVKTIDASRDHNMVWLVSSLLLGIIITLIVGRLMRKTLMKRSLIQ